MIPVTSSTSILIAIKPVDFRRQLDGLMAHCRQQLLSNPMSGTLFVFINRAKTMIRVPTYDGSGMWLMTFAAMRMVDADDLSLSAPINQYLTRWQLPDNDFTQQQPVTLQHLLSHTAGTTVHGFSGYAQNLSQPDAVQVLQGGAATNSEPVVDTLPGTQFRYSGGGYTVFQVAMEDVSNMSFSALLHDLVLNPIGMNQSTFDQPLPSNLWHKAASGHLSEGQAIEGKFNNYPEQAAAGLWTTPTELAKFYLAVMQTWHEEPGALLSPDLAKQFLSFQANTKPYPWGLGFRLHQKNGKTIGFHHGGANEGFRGNSVGFLDGRGAVIMINSDQGDIINEILAATAAAYDWPAHKVTEKEWLPLNDNLREKITGTYHTTIAGEIFKVTVKPDGEGIIVNSDEFNDKMFYWEKQEDDKDFFIAANGMSLYCTGDDEHFVLTIFGDDYLRDVSI